MNTLEKGISLFAGLGHPLQESLDYLERARRAGFSRLFTSLHIPEATEDALLREVLALTQTARELGFGITADISPRTFALFGGSPENCSPLRRLGLTALRLDDGFSYGEMARLTHEAGLAVELNASTLDETALERLLAAGAYASRLQGCHNYYPRPETGLSQALFAARCRLFASLGIPVAAFVPSLATPRGPLFAGLPTLEAHRGLPAAVAAKQLAASGLVQAILFGDPLASPEELAAVGRVEAQRLVLEVIPSPGLSETEQLLLASPHTNRTDPGAYSARSQEARLLASAPIPPRPPQPRPRGSVTADNRLYGRYAGEVQVVLRDLPADPKVNVIAQVAPAELCLLEWLTPGRPFAFETVKGAQP